MSLLFVFLLSNAFAAEPKVEYYVSYEGSNRSLENLSATDVVGKWGLEKEPCAVEMGKVIDQTIPLLKAKLEQKTDRLKQERSKILNLRVKFVVTHFGALPNEAPGVRNDNSNKCTLTVRLQDMNSGAEYSAGLIIYDKKNLGNPVLVNASELGVKATRPNEFSAEVILDKFYWRMVNAMDGPPPKSKYQTAGGGGAP